MSDYLFIYLFIFNELSGLTANFLTGIFFFSLLLLTELIIVKTKVKP